MAVRIWPQKFQHLHKRIDGVVAGLPSDLELPLPSLERWPVGLVAQPFRWLDISAAW
jgi:hypothetical protein